MANFTTNFKNLIDLGFVTRDEIENIFKSYRLEDYLTSEEIEVINKRGTFSKEKLAKKIVDHYYFRELGFETYAMFKHYAEIQMEEIMESKLPLIYSSAIKYDPLINVDYKEILSREQTDNGTSSGSGSGLAIDSNTPQGNINKADILAGHYATSTSANEQTSTSESNSKTNENYTKHIIGNSGVSATAQKKRLHRNGTQRRI
jgi:hypothetical protein